MKLLHVLHKLEPEGDWLKKALVSYTWTLDHALCDPARYWWGHDWLDTAMFEEFVTAAVKDRSPRREQRLAIAEAVGVRLKLVRRSTPPPDRPGTISWEEYFRLLVRTPSPQAKKKPSLSLERPRNESLAAHRLPADFPEPLWRNASFPDWPVAGKAHRDKLTAHVDG